MKTGRCDCPIDCQVINTVKAQKSMKSIVRVVHLPSVVQSEFYEATRILFVRKENKNNETFSTIRLSVSPFWRSSTERKCVRSSVSANTRMRYFRSNQSINTRRIRILVLQLIQKSIRILRSVANPKNGATVMRRDRGCIRKLKNAAFGGMNFWLTFCTFDVISSEKLVL